MVVLNTIILMKPHIVGGKCEFRDGVAAIAEYDGVTKEFASDFDSHSDTY